MSNWFKDRRQEFIYATLKQFGQINRNNIVQEFDVSTQQASKDLADFMESRSGVVEYDVSGKCYVLTANAREAIVSEGEKAKEQLAKVEPHYTKLLADLEALRKERDKLVDEADAAQQNIQVLTEETNRLRDEKEALRQSLWESANLLLTVSRGLNLITGSTVLNGNFDPDLLRQTRTEIRTYASDCQSHYVKLTMKYKTESVVRYQQKQHPC